MLQMRAVVPTGTTQGLSPRLLPYLTRSKRSRCLGEGWARGTQGLRTAGPRGAWFATGGGGETRHWPWFPRSYSLLHLAQLSGGPRGSPSRRGWSQGPRAEPGKRQLL